MKENINKVVLAYSGGLDTSVMVRWLKETYGCEIIGYTADIGQGPELDGLEEKAKKTGCSELVVVDSREEFVKDYVFFAIKASAVYEGEYLLGTSLARPVIAKKQIEIAREFGADAVAHGATGKGNDQVRFELGYYALMPEVKVLAPWRHWPFKSRSDLIAYAKEYDIPVTATLSKPYSTDANIMHTSYEGGVLEDPWVSAPEDIFTMTRSVDDAPDKAEEMIITFDKGAPIALDGETLSPAKLLEKLNAVAGRHGIGRIDIVENRYVGMKSRGVYETPGVTVLHRAHRALESITMDREVMKLRDSLSTKISELIYNGYWFSPEFSLIRTMVEDTQKKVSGEVRVKLHKGQASILGRRSPHSLYSEALATFEEDHVYNQADAEGFIKINSLRLRLKEQGDS